MKRLRDLFWPTVGLTAVGWSLYLLYQKLQKEVAVDPVVARLLQEGGFWSDLKIIASTISGKLSNIPTESYLLAGASTLLAYTALLWYDRIALEHLGRTKGISWLFVGLCSFVTYALGHNIGASVFSGGMVRIRAYSAKGLTPAEIAVLVGMCSITFVFGTILLLSFVLLVMPTIMQPLGTISPYFALNAGLVRWIGAALLLICTLYVLGAWLQFKPIQIGSFKLVYPRLSIVIKQYLAGPIELLGAIGIIYFALPEQGNPGFIVVMGAFLLSFSAGLLSQVPGGVGVMEAVFLALMPSIPASSVLAALLVWRLFYLLIPLAISTPVILAFERSQLGKASKEKLESERKALASELVQEN